MGQARSKVIVLGNNPVSRDFFVKELRERDYFAISAREAQNVQKYLSMPPAKHYDLVIMDLQWGEDADGIALGHFLHDHDIPLVIVTESEDIPEKYKRFCSTKGVWFVSRPFVPDNLLGLIKNICRQHVLVETKVR